MKTISGLWKKLADYERCYFNYPSFGVERLVKKYLIEAWSGLWKNLADYEKINGLWKKLTDYEKVSEKIVLTFEFVHMDLLTYGDGKFVALSEPRPRGRPQKDFDDAADAKKFLAARKFLKR